MKQHFSSSEDMPKPVATAAGESGSSSINVEVTGLSGESLLKDSFMMADTLEVIQKRIEKEHGHKVFRQQLVWQDNVLLSRYSLKELGLPPEGAVLQLMLRSLP